MKTVKINETPLRTARNYNVNNFEIAENELVKNRELSEFKNVEIISNSTKDIIVNEKIDNFELTYGISKDLEDQVKNYSNVHHKIEINSKLDNELIINYNFDKNNKVLIENIEIVANPDTKSTIIIKYNSDLDLNYYHNGIIRIIAKENSKINLILVNLLNNKSNNLVSLESEVLNSAEVKETLVDFGGKNSVTNNYINAIGKESKSRIDTIYLGKDDQRFDLNYVIHLRGEKAHANIEAQGAIKDEAKKVFKGTLDFKKGCKGAEGDENEFCMLLSKKAKSLGLPMLLCSEEDVVGNHSSASGKAGEKELFYLMTRGFSYKEAMKLLVRANFNKILENIKNDTLREEISKIMDEKLD